MPIEEYLTIVYRQSMFNTGNVNEGNIMFFKKLMHRKINIVEVEITLVWRISLFAIYSMSLQVDFATRLEFYLRVPCGIDNGEAHAVQIVYLCYFDNYQYVCLRHAFCTLLSWLKLNKNFLNHKEITRNMKITIYNNTNKWLVTKYQTKKHLESEG